MELQLVGETGELEIPFPPLLLDILAQDGFTGFIKGGKELGKTNLAMLLMEVCQALGIRKQFSTNIKTESYFITQIANKPDLDDWLRHRRGKKFYAMDELGKNLRKFGFASKRNQDLMDIIQLIRHFDCGFVGMAPAEKFVDSGFLIANDILDFEIRKISQQTAKVLDYVHNETYFWCDIPATSLKYDCKDIAKFDMEKPIDTAKLPICCQIAERVSRMKENEMSMSKVGVFFDLSAEEIKRQLVKHLKHAKNYLEVKEPEVLQKPVEDADLVKYREYQRDYRHGSAFKAKQQDYQRQYRAAKKAEKMKIEQKPEENEKVEP